jgi:2,3-diaminopropionate biosynthesis protein SbnA
VRELRDLSACSPGELRALADAIGETPLVPVCLLAPGPRRAHLKLEGANPGGSMKDRVALHMIRKMEREGRLRPGAALVDSTSGNFGISLAWLARAYGYRFLAVSDPNLTPENAARMRALGAELEIVEQRDETGGFLLTRIRRARALAESTPGAVWANQYSNPENPSAHEATTGPELLRQMEGRLDAVFIPASTGGTLAGVGAYLASASPRTRVVAVDGEGSSLFGGPAGPRLVNGLGSSRASDFLRSRPYHEVAMVSAAEAFTCCVQLRDATGIEVGGSSGAAIAACARFLAENAGAERVACICPDHGANYRSTVFDEEWRSRKGVQLRQEPLVGESQAVSG